MIEERFDFFKLFVVNCLIEALLFFVLPVVDLAGITPLSNQCRIRKCLLKQRRDLIVSTVLRHGEKRVSEGIALVARVECFLIYQYLNDGQVSFSNREVE